MKKILFSVLLLSVLSSCDNTIARRFGGTETVKLKPTEKLMNATWKGDQLWLITQDTVTGKCYMREKSRYGLLEGTVIFEK